VVLSSDGDYSGIAYVQAQFPTVFWGTVGIFFGMSICLFKYLTLCHGIRNKVLHYHRVPWIHLGKHCYIILQLTVSFSKTLRKCIVTWNVNEWNNCMKYDPVCVVELLLHGEKCISENDRLCGFGSLTNMFFWAYMYPILCLIFSFNQRTVSLMFLFKYKCLENTALA